MTCMLTANTRDCTYSDLLSPLLQGEQVTIACLRQANSPGPRRLAWYLGSVIQGEDDIFVRVVHVDDLRAVAAPGVVARFRLVAGCLHGAVAAEGAYLPAVVGVPPADRPVVGLVAGARPVAADAAVDVAQLDLHGAAGQGEGDEIVFAHGPFSLNGPRPCTRSEPGRGRHRAHRAGRAVARQACTGVAARQTQHGWRWRISGPAMMGQALNLFLKLRRT